MRMHADVFVRFRPLVERRHAVRLSSGAAQPREVAFEAGFGSLYWMEGVTFRLQVILHEDHHNDVEL